jgi:Domain of unknown function (DUF4412)
MNKTIIAITAIFSLTATVAAQPGNFMPKSSCTPKAHYYFNGSVEMATDMAIKGKDTNHFNMTMYMNATTNSFAAITSMNFGQNVVMTNITNLKDSQMVMLMDMGEMKTSSCHSLKDFRGNKGPKMFDPTAFNKVKPTGKTKLILGYTCKEFRYDSSNFSLSLWIAPELKDLSFANAGLGGQSGASPIPANMQGFALEMEMNDKSKNYSMHMLATKIDREAVKDISTEGFTNR